MSRGTWVVIASRLSVVYRALTVSGLPFQGSSTGDTVSYSLEALPHPRITPATPLPQRR